MLNLPRFYSILILTTLKQLKGKREHFFKTYTFCTVKFCIRKPKPPRKNEYSFFIFIVLILSS